MFDNPKKDLKRLEDRLWAAEQTDFEPPAQEDPDAALAEVKQLLQRDEWEEQGNHSLSRDYVVRHRQAEIQEEEDRQERLREARNDRSGGLLVALMLEIAALMGVIAWWALNR